MNSYNETAISLNTQIREYRKRQRRKIDCKACIDFYKGGCLCSHEVDNLKEIKQRKCFKPRVAKR